MWIANLALLATSLSLQAALLVTLWRQSIQWRFPFFVAYTTYSVLMTVALLLFSHNYRLYFYLFWGNEAGLGLLAMLSLHEVFRRVFFGFYLQFPWFRVLFPSAVLAAFLFVLGGAAEVPDSGQSAMRLILLFGVAVNFIQVGLFCFLIAIGRTFRLRWHFAPLGIILGFTASALGSAIGFWSRSEFGTKFVILADYAPPVAYILANFIWLDTFLRPEPEPQWISAATMNQIAEQLRRDSVMLKKIMERLK